MLSSQTPWKTTWRSHAVRLSSGAFAEFFDRGVGSGIGVEYVSVDEQHPRRSWRDHLVRIPRPRPGQGHRPYDQRRGPAAGS